MFRLLALATCLMLAAAQPISFDQADNLWETFKTIHKRNYQGELETVRKHIFLQNVQHIEQHNAEADLGLHNYWLGVNQFTDQTNAEFRKMNGFKMPKNRTSGTTFLAPENMPELPTKVDWRTKGYVTPVKDQKQCGSCWAFSATGSMEGQHYRATGKLVSLSEQNLVDCSGPEGNEGCNGGFMDQAFVYVEKTHGIDTEQCYPYEARDDNCRVRSSCFGASFHTHSDVVPHGDENALKTAVATQGPISIAIDASHQSFQSYSHGIYDEPDCSSEQLDHGVLIVGYGSNIRADGTPKDYWIVKNSWNAGWGMKGYIHMSRNKNNQCGVATLASFPRV